MTRRVSQNSVGVKTKLDEKSGVTTMMPLFFIMFVVTTDMFFFYHFSFLKK